MGSSCCSCQGRLPNLEEDLHISNLELIDEVNDLRKLHKEDIEASKIYNQGQAIFRGTLNRNKQKEGYGEYFNQDKVFFGIFANDMPSGPGLAVKNDESYYSGHFEDGTFHGFGKEYGPNYFFQGEFSKGERKKGVFKNDKFQYHGQFRDNKFQDDGLIIFSNGVRYEGPFSEGKMKGKGVIVFQHGKIYKGEVADGRCVKGKFEWAKDRKSRQQQQIQRTEEQLYSPYISQQICPSSRTNLRTGGTKMEGYLSVPPRG